MNSISETSQFTGIVKRMTAEVTRRREFFQASPDESSCETLPPLASNDLVSRSKLGDFPKYLVIRLRTNPITVERVAGDFGNYR